MKLDRFINRPVLSTVISIVIVVLGILGLLTLPITQYPDIAPPTVSVRATYTGANAQTVLNSVIAPLEDQINGVENMMYMTSSASNNGSAEISIYFKQGTDPDMAAVNVQNRVSMAQGLLPAEVTKIGVTTQKRQNSMLIVFAVYDSEDRYDLKFLENYAKINLIPEVQRIPGVGDANVLGTDYSMRIWLKPDVMAQYKLVPTDVSAALAEQNVEAAPGSFGDQGNQTFQYTLRYKGRLQTAEEFDQIVIKALPDGEVLRLKDIANIELGRLSYNFVNKVNGHNAVACIVYQMPGTNATETISSIQDLLVESEKTMPPGMKVEVSMNANDFLFASIHEVIKTLIEAFILVFIVVYIFLQDMRSTLIPAIAIPVALVGTFFLLSLIGFSLNLLTLCAMVLAIAIVVDDAIVVVEGVHAKLDHGYTSAKQASIDAMSELGGAIVSITLVMMSVFIPVSFIGGTAGVFYRQFGLTMALAIGISALNALTLSPALCALFLKPHDAHGEKKSTFASRFHTSFNVAYDLLLISYKKRVLFFIQKKWLAFGTVAAAIALLVFFMRVTPTGMVPNEDMGTIMGAVTLPPGTSQERTLEVMARVDSLVASDPAVKSRTAITGFSFIGGQGPSYGSFIIKLKDWDERSMQQNAEVVYASLFMRARKVVKDAQVLFFTPPMIPGYSASSDIELNMQDKTGGSLEKFFSVSKDYMAALTARPEIKSAQSTFNPNFPQYMIDIDAAACKKAGISPSDILMTLQGYYGGLYASNFNRFGKMYRVMVQADPSMRANLESLKKIKIRNGNEMAPISQFVTIEKVYGPDIISRFNMYTSMKVMVAPAEGFTSGQALKALGEVAATSLPAGFGYELGGMAREEAETSGSTTGLIFLLCFLFVYLLLSAQYESYVLPLAVLLSIPFGLMGSFLFVQGWAALGSIPALKMILGTMSNNIYMQIALIMLMGLLAKNAILIVEFALDRRRQGMSIAQAAVSGAAARLRPILMTSLAMVVGLLPMMFAFGVGAHGNRTLGTAAIGGMFIGMIFQVLIVPALFVVFQFLQEKVKPVVFVLCLPLLASSCHIYKAYERPEAIEMAGLYRDPLSVTDTLAADTANIGNLPWKEVFRDLHLQVLVEEGLTNNVDMQAAVLRVGEAKALLTAARLSFLPSLNLAPQGSATTTGNSDFAKAYTLPAIASWEVDLFGKLLNASREQKAIYLQSEYARQAVRSQLICGIANTYFTLLMLDRQLEITSETVDLYAENVRAMEVMKTAGMTTEAAVAQMQAAYHQVSASFIQLQQQVREVENALSVLLAKAPQRIERGRLDEQIVPEVLLAGIPLQLLENRPDVKIAEMSLARAYYTTNKARAAFYPGLNITATAGWTNGSGITVANPGQFLFQALASLAQPVFNNGKLTANLKVSKAEEEIARMNYQQAILEAGKEVSDALHLYEASSRMLQEDQSRIEALEKAVTYTKALFQSAQSSYLEILSAEQSLLNAQLTAVSDRIRRMQAVVNLYSAVGGGRE